MATAAGTTAGATSALSLSDVHKRWLVFGISLNKILVPSLRPYVEQGLLHAYGNVTASHNIHSQSSSGRLQRCPRFLKYENINGNDVHPKSSYALFDCRVTSHVDFAKLYLQTHMAKFNAFDERCDASALLVLLSGVPGFSVAVQAAADDVRERRNAWAHCDFSEWDAVVFQQSFEMMEQLVRVLGLPSADEGKLLSELKTWETTGTTLCMNSPVDPDLLHLIQHHVNTLQGDLCNLTFELEEQRDAVRKALQDSATKLQELETRLSKVETDQMYMKQEIMDIQIRFGRVEEKQSRDAGAVGSIADVYSRADRGKFASASHLTRGAGEFDSSPSSSYSNNSTHLPLLTTATTATTSAATHSRVKIFTKPFAPSSIQDIQIGMEVLVTRSRGQIGRGVVKYVGPLPSRKDTYIGMELGPKQVGKTDGSLDGKRFFHCKPNRGIFVSFNKVVMCHR